jgi:hypothetical protein
MHALNSRIGRDVKEMPVGQCERGGVVTDTQAN